MSVEVRRATPDDLERWDRHVERSPAGGLFHQLSALEVQAAHTDTRLHPLIGHKGQEPVGVFPVFERTIGPRPAASVRTAFSPPPGIHVIDCGPASLNLAKLKQRKAERRHERFVAGAFEWIDEAIDPVYTHLRLPGAYPDTRPFAWNDCTVTPRHT
ncbi:MAG: GNAT family N-acetyltransferase, partial [Haloarculaceae archaeon]